MNWKAIARLFLKLGFTAFGGPAAHIAMMQEEVVNRLRWMDHQHFLDLIGATNLIPGPNSTEMAIHIGYERGGWKGLLIAGCCFIGPAVLITGVIAALYRHYGQLPEVQDFIYGIKPAILAIIVSAVWPLARKAVKSLEMAVIGIGVLAAVLMGVNEIIALFAAGAAAIGLFLARRSRGTVQSVGPWFLFFTFLKIGAILYGSGYVLFAFLDSELVSKGLLTRAQLMDAIAVGQFTPGPVFSSVTFIGWQIGGLQGAVLATVGVFLPSFLFVWLLNPMVPWMRRSGGFSAFLDGVNVASVAIILGVCVAFGREAVQDWKRVVVAVVSLVVVFGFKKVNSVFVVVGGALLGYALLKFSNLG
ncbi:MAG: chromate transporter [Bacteroidetes bacterium]|nr:chromate transporter [Bacteroidota bacterium]